MNVCKDCGQGLKEDGSCPKGAYPLNKESLELVVKLECAGCGAKVTLETIRKQGLENWTYTEYGKVFCKYCSHRLQLISK